MAYHVFELMCITLNLMEVFGILFSLIGIFTIKFFNEFCINESSFKKVFDAKIFFYRFWESFKFNFSYKINF